MPPPTCSTSTRCRERLDAMLVREGRMELALACFAFLPIRAQLDLAGFAEAEHLRTLSICSRSACSRLTPEGWDGIVAA